MNTLEELYTEASEAKSDINEHVPKLRELSSQCCHVTEFGMRYGVSTTAILAGQPKRFITYDIAMNYGIVSNLKAVSGGCDLSFVEADVLKIPPIESTDMLFIDTIHNAKQLLSELELHADRVKKWIVLHDTHIYGLRGENGGEGLDVGLREWMGRNSCWKTEYRVEFNNGLTVLSRNEPQVHKNEFVAHVWNPTAFSKDLL